MINNIKEKQIGFKVSTNPHELKHERKKMSSFLPGWSGRLSQHCVLRQNHRPHSFSIASSISLLLIISFFYSFSTCWRTHKSTRKDWMLFTWSTDESRRSSQSLQGPSIQVHESYNQFLHVYPLTFSALHSLKPNHRLDNILDLF